MTLPRADRLVIVSVLALALGCRAGSMSGAAEAGPGGGAGTSDTTAAGDEAPTRREPPIVRPAADVVVETIAGSSTNGSADGAGAAAQFDNPVGVLLDPSGGLFVTEYDGGRLRKLDGAGSSTTVATGLVEAFGMVLTGDALYVQTDSDRNGQKGPDTGTIWKLPLGGGTPEVVIESLGRPRGLARLLDGRIAVADRERNTLSILDPASRTLTLLAGSTEPGFVNGRGAAARFNKPYGLAVLPDGNILVTDSFNHVIRKVTLEGDVSVFAGDGNPGMKDDPDKLRARFDRPMDIALDVAGNVFVTDPDNHRIRRITSDGSVETIAGDGTRGFADGTGLQAKFYGQEQIDVSPDGKTIYVSDGNLGDGSAFHRVRRIRLP